MFFFLQLKQQLNLAEKYGEYTTVPGTIISRDISNYSKTLVINIGSDNGVKENMTVIADEGLVGYIVSTTAKTAKIQTIVKAGGCYTKEADLANAKWRYFSTYDISTLFGISNVSDDIVVNFANRDVVSLKGIEKNGVTHYSEYTL